MRSITNAFRGGIDQVSAALAVPPARVISAMNYEPLAEGYGRCEGFERFDGRPGPGAARYWILDFDNGAAPIGQTQIVTGATSGATGVVLVEPVGVTGSWPEGTAAGSLVLGRITGTFQNDEILQVAGAPKATAKGLAVPRSAPSEALNIAYTEAAQYDVRSAIAKMPGQGPVRGVAVHKGLVYAWRDAVGGNSAKMYVANVTGWVQVDLGTTLKFTAGAGEILDGQTITGVTSGASAKVERIIRTSGSWGTNAAGYIRLGGPISGTFQPGENIAVATVPKAKAGATDSVKLEAGGRYHAITHNFFALADTEAMYFVNGRNGAMEFRNGIVTPIRSGKGLLDLPLRIFEVGQHLGLTFEGGSVVLSATGDPFNYDAIEGAVEIGFGSEITDVVQAVETAVVLFGQTRIGVLTGRDKDTFQLEELTEEAGADAWTAQRIGTTIYLDHRGLRDLRATQAYGNFKTGALSGLFEPYLRSKRSAGASPVASIVGRSKTHYRLFWDDGTGFTCYMGGKTPEMLPFDLNGVQVTCADSGELASGFEGMFVGADDGHVYQLDSGTNFDGERVRAFVMTPFFHFGSPYQNDRFYKVDVELQAGPSTNIGVIAQFNYGDGTTPNAGNTDFNVVGSGAGLDFLVQGGGGTWDSAVWDEFFWSQPVEGTAEAYVDGFGRNASFVIATRSDLTEPAHVLQAYTVHLSSRKMRR